MTAYSVARNGERAVIDLLGGEVIYCEDGSYNFFWQDKKIIVRTRTSLGKVGGKGYTFPINSVDIKDDITVVFVALEPIANNLYWVVKGVDLKDKKYFYAKIEDAVNSGSLKEKLLD